MGIVYHIALNILTFKEIAGEMKYLFSAWLATSPDQMFVTDIYT